MLSGPIVFVYYYLLLIVIALYWWWRFRAHRSEIKFSFHIRDIWACMLGLLPSIILTGQAIQELEKESMGMWSFSALITGPAQIVGLLIGRVHIELPPHTGSKNAFDSAVSIIAGAFIGILMGVACLVASNLFQVYFRDTALAFILSTAFLIILFAVVRYNNSKP